MFGQQTMPTQTQGGFIMNTATYSNNINRKRQDDNKRGSYRDYVSKFEKFEQNQFRDELVEVKRAQRRTKQQNEELMMEERYQNSQRQREQQQMLQQQDAKMAAALFDMQNQRNKQEKEHRRIVENSKELAALRQKIDAAKTFHKRSQQQELIVQREQIDLQKDSALDQMMEDRRRQAEADAHVDQQRRSFANVQGKRALQNQMAEKEHRKFLAYQESLKEKAAVDTVVRELEEQDRVQKEYIAAQKKATWEEIKMFVEDQKRFFQHEKKRTERELADIQRYEEMQAQRKREVMEMKQQSSAAREAVLAKLSKEMEAKRREAEEFRMLLMELYQVEAERRADEEIARRRETEARRIEEFKVANRQHLWEREHERREEEKKREAEHAAIVMQFVENARLEELNERERKMKMIQFRREAIKMTEERKKQFAQDVAATLLQQKEQADEEALKQQIIARERVRLLRQNAEQLRRFLPKDMFKTQEEVDAVWGDAPPTSPFNATRMSEFNPNQGSLKTEQRSEYTAKKPVFAYAPRANNFPNPSSSLNRSPNSRGASPSNRFSSHLRFAGSSSLSGSPTHGR